MRARGWVVVAALLAGWVGPAATEPIDEVIEDAWVDIVLVEPRPAWRSAIFGPAVVELWPQLPALVPPDSARYLRLTAGDRLGMRALLDSGLDPLVASALVQGRVSNPDPGKVRRGDLLVFAYHSEEHGEDWPPGTGVGLVIAVTDSEVVVDIVDNRYRTQRRRLPMTYLATPASHSEGMEPLPLIVGGEIAAGNVYFLVVRFQHDLEVAVQFPGTSTRPPSR